MILLEAVKATFLLLFTSLIFTAFMALCYFCKNSEKLLKNQGEEFEVIMPEIAVEAGLQQLTHPINDRRRG